MWDRQEHFKSGEQASIEACKIQERKIQELSLELHKAQEEIAELKTLIAFYEENSSLPAL